MNQQTNSRYLIPLILIAVLFFMIGFALGINGLLIPYLQQAFQLSNAESYLVLTATFSAFVIFGYPSGKLVAKIGYKKSMILSFLFFAIGLYLFIPSAQYESFSMFLIASFICGAGNTLLQTAVNPYVTICGPIETATRRISIMGILNKSGWAIAPIFLAIFLDLKKVQIELSDIFIPFYIIVGVFIVLMLFVQLVSLPELKAQGEEELPQSPEALEIASFANSKKNILGFPHLILGMLTLFFYVGVETVSLATIVDFADTIKLPNPENYTSYTVVAMVIGYILGAVLVPNVISQITALRFCTMLGAIFSLCLVLSPTSVAIYFLALLGLANSLIWAPVWPLAISYLGKYTKSGASLLVIAIVGGAIIPLLFGFMKDVLGNIQQAYWICFPLYLYMIYYAFYGYKVGLAQFYKKKNEHAHIQ